MVREFSQYWEESSDDWTPTTQVTSTCTSSLQQFWTSDWKSLKEMFCDYLLCSIKTKTVAYMNRSSFKLWDLHFLLKDSQSYNVRLWILTEARLAASTLDTWSRNSVQIKTHLSLKAVSQSGKPLKNFSIVLMSITPFTAAMQSRFKSLWSFTPIYHLALRAMFILSNL